MKHTPEPWTVEFNSIRDIHPRLMATVDGSRLCIASSIGTKTTRDTMRTIIHLIRDDAKLLTHPMLAARRNHGHAFNWWEHFKTCATLAVIITIAVIIMGLMPTGQELNEACKGAINVFTHP